MANDPKGNVQEVSATQAYAALQSDARAQIVDVRTKAEWAFVGVPDVSHLGKDTILAEWQIYPSMAIATGFAEGLEQELRRHGVSRDDSIFFLCRSGARSRAAAQAMADQGWSRCYNIADGFEGPLDGQRRRGNKDGWKASGLPWGQS